MQTLIIFIPFIAIMYFMVIRPQQRQVKEKQVLISSVAAGDDVLLGSGIYGTVTEVEDTVVWVEVAQDIELKVARSAVEEIFRDEPAELEDKSPIED